ncbi:hypothetical protein [Rhizobium ruizarguesonis]|uniref:hypothetical protein n=1 Tax=Rhizobium ruizarguesonis TaxID=2081791 RepID=UPI00102FC304|nr:hypothetical protein [Rhizobium ruizarguesonis]TAV04500.1 hypothetical protein ELI39_03945 [Rhizobium ruizarguesonis]
MTVADEVEALARKHGIDVAVDEAAWLAIQFTRLSDGGAIADRTVLLVADMMRDDILTHDQGGDLILRHIREQPDNGA